MFRPGHTRMQYVTRISTQMQKHMFGVTCPGVLFMGSTPGPQEHKNSVSTFCTPDALECTM
jgi:hypothetical protein